MRTRSSLGIGRMLASTLASTLAGMLVVSTMAAQQPATKAPAKTSVAGDWNASYNTPGGTTAFAISFVVNGEKLSGTVHRASGDLPLTGSTKNDSVSFVFTIQYNEHGLDMTINAKVAGDSMQGSVDFGGEGQDTFEAKRASAPGKP